MGRPISQIEAASVTELIHNYQRLTPRQQVHLHQLLVKIAGSYSDDPGTSDLWDSQPISLSINLGDVRLVRQLVR